jgi:hypothetical protein
MSGSDGQTTAEVPGSQAGGKRAGATEPARSTVAPPVWTKRMLATLDEGVEGGKWYSLIDKVYRENARTWL